MRSSHLIPALAIVGCAQADCDNHDILEMIQEKYSGRDASTCGIGPLQSRKPYIPIDHFTAMSHHGPVRFNFSCHQKTPTGLKKLDVLPVVGMANAMLPDAILYSYSEWFQESFLMVMPRSCENLMITTDDGHGFDQASIFVTKTECDRYEEGTWAFGWTLESGAQQDSGDKGASEFYASSESETEYFPERPPIYGAGSTMKSVFVEFKGQNGADDDIALAIHHIEGCITPHSA